MRHPAGRALQNSAARPDDARAPCRLQNAPGAYVDVVEKIWGNRNDAVWVARLRGADIDWLELSQWDAQKNRLRKTSLGGKSVAVALERGQSLHDGDILDWDEEQRRAVICRIRLCPVMVVNLSGLSALSSEEAVSSAVRLGHALGNQHWPAVVRDGFVYVPMTADEKVMNAVMETHAIAGIGWEFLPGESVSGRLSAEEARLLFGGAEESGHHHHHHHHDHHA